MLVGLALTAIGGERTLVRGKNKIMTACVAKVRADLPNLDLTSSRTFSEEEVRYFRFYGLVLKGCVHHFGWRVVDGRRLATHVYLPPTPRGTILVSHGYYDHAGAWRNVIPLLVAAGFRVVIYDQPGHGLSDGARATIGDFSEYVSVLTSFVALCRARFDGPLHLATHSMGGAVVVEYLLVSDPPPVDRVVLVAPLCRSSAWHVSRLGHRFAGSWVESVPRKYRANSSDKAFLKFVREDPLQPEVVPMQWVGALGVWNERVLTYKPLPKQTMLVIQGGKDGTVDAAYNDKLLQRKFPLARIVAVVGAGHQLFNETSAMRERALKLMVEEFTRDGE